MHSRSTHHCWFFLPAFALMLMLGCTPVDRAEETFPLTEVESTAISHIGYDPATQSLTLVFRAREAPYVYQGVPLDVYREMMAAESIGGFYHQHIRGHYEQLGE